MTPDIVVQQLVDSSDDRGLSFSLLADQLGLIGDARDVHIATVRPGYIRGNHFHATRGEVIAVVFRSPWSLHWDKGAGTRTHHRAFSGTGAVLIAPPTNWSHAVRNDGTEDLLIVAVSDAPYDRFADDPVLRDAIPRIVTGVGE